MEKKTNIYCDESCHLENDSSNVMVLGAVWCPKNNARGIAEIIREIKKRHKLPPFFEIKWNKVSPSKLEFYLELIDYFFEEKHLHFRSVVIPDKSSLKHSLFNQSHDDFYYKMYYVLLKNIIKWFETYYIYLDIKDSKSAAKVRILSKILANVTVSETLNIQNARSHEIEQIQMTDLLIGAVCYKNRNLETSKAKLAIIDKIETDYGKRPSVNSPMTASKFNMLIWRASQKEV